MLGERRWSSTALWLFLAGMVGVAACVIPERDRFPDGVSIDANLGENSTTGGGGTGGSGSGSGSLCMMADDCPANKECTVSSCVNGVCQSQYQPAGAPCSGGVAGVCDNSGDCVQCIADKNCLDTAAMCSNNVCVSCANNVKDGDETGVDCGGDYCPRCNNGEQCKVSADCLSGFCADGVCCADACDNVCMACNIKAYEGMCNNVPFGMSDPTCMTPHVCTGVGVCKLGIGENCNMSSECASGICKNSQCM
jgi:hypothetical protein